MNTKTMTIDMPRPGRRAVATPSRPDAPSSLIARGLIFAYGLAAYGAFLGVFLYMIGFVMGLVVPKGINDGAVGDTATSLLVNTGLLSLFVVQHTIMARPRFKAWFTRFLPAAMERSTFVLAASAVLALLCWQWRPLTQIIWDVETPAARIAVMGVSVLGWLTVLASTFLISHFDLFGLRQVLINLRQRRYPSSDFRVVGLYRIVRHPLMLGFLIAMWATPRMTVGHLFFVAMVTAYVFVGVYLFEERDLIATFGERYRQYQRAVPGVLPMPRRLRVWRAGR